MTVYAEFDDVSAITAHPEKYADVAFNSFLSMLNAHSIRDFSEEEVKYMKMGFYAAITSLSLSMKDQFETKPVVDAMNAVVAALNSTNAYAESIYPELFGEKPE